jgi:DNA polymerase III subunit delta
MSKLDRARTGKVLDDPRSVRCILLYGPDEAASRALADRAFRTMGDGAERVILSPGTLKADPARLADEAASLGLFGGARLVLVDGCGEESTEAVRGLFALPVVSNPVVLVAGALKRDSKLLALVSASREAFALASYVPTGAEADRLAADLARAAGLDLTPDLAHTVVEASGGDRAILAQELSKLALFVDAGGEARKSPNPAEVDAIIAGGGRNGTLSRLIGAVLDGDPAAVEHEIEQLATGGIEAIQISRALTRQLLAMAPLRAEVEAGSSATHVLGAGAGQRYGRSAGPTARQLGRWTSQAIATALRRLLAAEQAAMRGRGAGQVIVESEVIAIARHAERLG